MSAKVPFAGCGDAYGVMRDAWANYRDESFILQFLSPAVIRKQKLFRLVDDSEDDEIVVASIHDERGYKAVRQSLSRQFDVGRQDPDIQVADVDLAGDRKLILHHNVVDGVTLEAKDTAKVLHHLANLWGYDVKLLEIEDGDTVAAHDGSPSKAFR